MGDVERAVALLLDPSASQDLKRQAVDYLHSLKSSPLYYRSAMQSLRLMRSGVGVTLPLAFYHLQSLEDFLQTHYPSLSVSDRGEMHVFLEEILKNGEGLLCLDISLLNKFSLVYAKVLIVDFPHVWSNGVNALLEVYDQGRLYRMLLLSVLQMIHEEVIDDETRSVTVEFARAKQLRVIIKECVLPIAIPRWKSELDRPDSDLKAATLTVCGRYMGLMSLEDAVGFMSLLGNLLGTYQVTVLGCVQSLIRKAMTTEQKLSLINSLQILPYLQRTDFKSIDTEDSDLLKSLAMVTNALGVALIECRDQLHLYQVMEIALRLFGSSQPLICRSVFEFFRAFTHTLKVKGDLTPPEPLTEAEKNAVGSLCLSLMERAKVPRGYSYRSGNNSDEEDQFYLFRDDLGDLFKDLLRLEATKEPVLGLLGEKLAGALQGGQTSEEVVEVLLFLLFLYSDCLMDLHQILTSDSPLSRTLRMVFTSPFPSSLLVLRTLFDLTVRIASFFDTPQTEPLLQPVISQMLSMMLSPDPELSGFAVKRVIGLVIRAQKPTLRYAENILEASKTVISQNTLDFPSLSKLFKALGLLLGNPGLNDSVKYTQIQHFSHTLLTNCTAAKLQQLSELLSGIGRRGNAEFQANLLSLFLYIAEQLTSGPLAVESYEAVASLTHRFSICLEGSASASISHILCHMSVHLTLDTLDVVMKLVSNLSQTCMSSIQPQVLSSITFLMVRSVPTPEETVSDYAQEVILHRRNYVKMLEAVTSKGWNLTELDCFPTILDYLRSIVSNSYELIVIST